MPTAYALAYITRGNSFHRCYGVFYQDSNKPEIIQWIPEFIDGGFENPYYFGKNIAMYHMNDNEKNLKNPISFEKPCGFPLIGQLDTGGFTLETIFEELTPREKKKALKGMMKTLKSK